MRSGSNEPIQSATT
ncbi:uncharacterized protein FFB20_10372 [Fusarium fujikuroi]|nr:uncharacterized protein FFE2_02274 [Fusarium fujikuroi]SCN97421.1 uncharacterized protein FFB20_10372 [Fusarium fujikuroi]SCO14091.1 uncharacterized protein FFC1_12063 [Fusarium fujikuroi]SCV54294.1 uncharacterized protein FFFS_11170 [Fusarium fujikuroi]